MQLRKIVRAGVRYFFDARYRFLINAGRGKYNKMSDEAFLAKMFYAKMGKSLDLKNPKTFNEKLQWLKLYHRKPEYTQMVDKDAVKPYVAERIGKAYLIPTLGVWERFADIDFDTLPDQFVLKCTHDSGGLVICRDKSKLNLTEAKKKILRSLAKNYYYHCREWPYKNVKPQIIAEKYMQDEGNENLPVYKIFNFGGEPRIIQVIQNDKTADETIDYFDTQWHLLALRQNYPNSQKPLKKPAMLERMLELARLLSTNIPFVRTDFYTVNGNIYFSEFTFYSDAGFERFVPEQWDDILGSWIQLPDMPQIDAFCPDDLLYRNQGQN